MYPDHAWQDSHITLTLNAHLRSIKEYRRIVPAEADMYGMCRNAGHLDQCIWRLNGHQYPPPPKWLQTFKHN
jgi:hypothetical protein